MNKQIVVAVVLAVLLVASAYAQTKDFFELVRHGTPQDVQAAIDNGADVNARDTRGWTPLINAALFNQNPEVITTLLKAGADLKAEDTHHGGTALLWAAWDNLNPEVVTTLLKAGADIEARNTALLWAAGNNQNLEVVTTLLEAGADVNAQNKSGATALMYAAAYNQNPEVITTLLKAGADI